MPQTMGGVKYDLNAARYMKTYLIFNNTSIPVVGGQDGEKLEAAPSGDVVTTQKSFEGTQMYFISNDRSGTFTLNTVPGSHVNNLLQWFFDLMQNADILTQDPTFGVKSVNSLTGRTIVGNACLISGQPTEQENSGAWTLPWKIQASEYYVQRPDPDELAMLK
ncbi:hypothetical protein [Levilactobacillus sp. 244-2]|uniref:hypothetical protein n=1 Tax=Levilactobacillus sp. 244-2 TaxID=2799569 RepID=UPI00194DD4DB|nr:hypothetical protein [Levilactobacillus sp. 244-2]